MHAKPDLRVVLKWMINRSGSVITDVIPLKSMAMNANPYEPPTATQDPDSTPMLYAENECPSCGNIVSNWSVINVAWKYKCSNCSAELSVEHRNQFINQAPRLMGLFYLLPLGCKLAGIQFPTALFWITLSIVVIAFSVAKIKYGMITTKRPTAG